MIHNKKKMKSTKKKNSREAARKCNSIQICSLKSSDTNTNRKMTLTICTSNSFHQGFIDPVC